MNLNEREQKRANSPVSAMIGVNKPEKAEKEKKQKKGEKEGLIQRGYYLSLIHI